MKVLKPLILIAVVLGLSYAYLEYISSKKKRDARASWENLTLERDVPGNGLANFLVKQDIEGSAGQDYLRIAEMIKSSPEIEKYFQLFDVPEIKRTAATKKKIYDAVVHLRKLGLDNMIWTAIRRTDQNLEGTVLTYDQCLKPEEIANFVSLMKNLSSFLREELLLYSERGSRKTEKAYASAIMTLGYNAASQQHSFARTFGLAIVVGGVLHYGMACKAEGDLETPKVLAEAMKDMAENKAYIQLNKDLPKIAASPENFDILEKWLSQPVYARNFAHHTACSVSYGWKKAEVASGKPAPQRRAFLEKMAASSAADVSQAGKAGLGTLSFLESLKAGEHQEKLSAFSQTPAPPQN